MKIDFGAEQSFLHDVGKHAMTIVKCDGVHRHIRFADPETFAYHFDIITWPGHLCITGDMHSFLFSRVPDMFTFFRGRDAKGPLEINPDYWSEKLLAAHSNGGSGGGCTEYSAAVFKERLRERWLDYCRDRNVLFLRSEELWQEIGNCVIYQADDGEAMARAAAEEFESEDFKFDDFWETDLSVYTSHFLWCLRAIVWGIRQFDAAQAAAEKAEAA